MTWLVLEDNLGRTEAFFRAVEQLSRRETLLVWRFAPQMVEELPQHLDQTTLISLDHDLYRHTDDDPDPGSGRDVANFLATLEPTCPVIIHSTNIDAAWGMYNELSFAGWTVEIVHHMDEPGWVEAKWLALARALSGTDGGPDTSGFSPS